MFPTVCMRNKCQITIKSTDLESLLGFEIALVFISWGFYMECFMKKDKKVKGHINFLARFWQQMWPIGQIRPTPVFVNKILLECCHKFVFLLSLTTFLQQQG